MTAGAVPSGTGRLAEVRRLLPIWTVREIRAQYRQSAFDIGWSLITPVLTLVGFGFVLTQAFGVKGDAGIPYLSFAWSGLVVWTFIANGLIRASLSLVSAADLVRKVAFPKEVVPLASVLSSGLDLLVGLAVLGILMAIQGVGVSGRIIAIVPVLAALVLWTSAWAVVFATFTSFVRDVSHGLTVVLRVGIFVTPVMYPAKILPARFDWVVEYNPAAVFVEALRACVLHSRWPDWSLLGAHTVVAGAVLLLALWHLHRVEGRIADVI